MNIDFSAKLLDLEGKPIIDVVAGADGAPVQVEATLGRAAVNVLLAMTEDDRGMSGSDKAGRFALALKLQGAAEVDVTIEEVALIKRLTGQVFGPLVVGRCWALLDPKAT